MEYTWKGDKERESERARQKETPPRLVRGSLALIPPSSSSLSRTLCHHPESLSSALFLLAVLLLVRLLTIPRPIFQSTCIKPRRY